MTDTNQPGIQEPQKTYQLTLGLLLQILGISTLVTVLITAVLVIIIRIAQSIKRKRVN